MTLRGWTVLAMAATLCGGSEAAGPREWAGRVVGVHDGDSLEVMRGGVAVKIRLYGVDCPEPGQAFGQRAKQRTSELAFGKVVTVRERTRDRYQRMVAEVALPGGGDLSRELVRSGLAWWYRKYAKRDAELMEMEREAREEKRGLWADPQAAPPWEWRKRAHA